jgi:hypothetical protein
MKQFEQCWFIRMVNQTMVFIARRLLIFAALQFVVITRYYNELCLPKNKKQHALNPIQLRFLGQSPRFKTRRSKETMLPQHGNASNGARVSKAYLMPIPLTTGMD